MTRYVVDTNVFVYARGLDHPYREPCRRLVDGARQGRLRLDASVELVQEFSHLLLRRGVDRDEAVEEAAQVQAQCRIHPFDDQVLALALGMVRHYPRLGVRDAVHAATAMAVGVPQLLSADRVFDMVAEVERIDPTRAAADLPS